MPKEARMGGVASRRSSSFSLGSSRVDWLYRFSSSTRAVTRHEVDPTTAFASEEHDGRRYYFDSRECHYEFLAAPHRYGHIHSPDDPRLEQDEITGP